MFELLGYWSIVSVITLSVALPFFFLLYLAVISMTGKILDNRRDGRNAVHKIIQFDEEEGIYYRNNIVVNSWVMWSASTVGILSLLFTAIHAAETEQAFGTVVIDVTHKFATSAAPAGLWLVIPFALYFGIIYGGRKYIKVKAKLATITSKLKEMDNV